MIEQSETVHLGVTVARHIMALRVYFDAGHGNFGAPF
jgi:hypothetical protein